ncbi:putative tetratricopeptide-like helical domain-containing protein [Medicago truncatula]|uniref:Putative tetratricopeptide-like helical domain-containing protein n=1 Tax=Medicago truncatula TaxID=3880 RepID=G7IPV9_MEDTR|nr:uncharacterized protein LOC11438868 [Medicago truncatula]AES64177.1 transmembrane protein, putative [Medicago truncatula]RHN72280.1 putative tetratricopeptide-like helical domain-containing protein [Medicago truncatula]
MNQLAEKLINLSLSSNYHEDMRKFILAFISKYDLNIKTATLAVVIVILGSLYLSTYGSNRRSKVKLKPKSEHFDRTRSWIVREIHSGKPILDRLKEDFNKARVNPATLKHTKKVLKALLNEEYLDLIKIQQAAEKLEMSGSEDSAVEVLERAVEKAENANKPHEVYEIEMFLVEMLIYKGELDRALNRTCLKDDSLKDARRPLYKAIIYQMKGNTEKADECWNEFLTVQDPPCTGFSLYKFKKNVERLQSAIQELSRTKGQ